MCAQWRKHKYKQNHNTKIEDYYGIENVEKYAFTFVANIAPQKQLSSLQNTVILADYNSLFTYEKPL